MKFNSESAIVSCGCRSVGECTHNIFSEVQALHMLVDAFASEMKTKLTKQYIKGYTGWDSHSWGEKDILQALDDHVKKRDMVDVANFAMFKWNRE